VTLVRQLKSQLAIIIYNKQSNNGPVIIEKLELQVKEIKEVAAQSAASDLKIIEAEKSLTALYSHLAGQEDEY
jgi:hypothetical protein